MVGYASNAISLERVAVLFYLGSSRQPIDETLSH